MIDPEVDQKFKDLYRKLKAQEIIVTQNKGRAYLSATQTGIASGVWTKIAFDTWDFNCNNSVLSANGIVIQERGLYLAVLLHEWVDLVPNCHVLGRIDLGATPQDYDQNCVTTHGTSNLKNVSFIEADIGDVVYGYARHTSVATPDLVGGNAYNTNLQVHLISRQCK
jgi:hypothetical protein